MKRKRKLNSTQKNHLRAINRRINFWFKNNGSNINGEKPHSFFIKNAGLPKKPEHISCVDWLLEQYLYGILRNFPIEKTADKAIAKEQKRKRRYDYLAYIDSLEWGKKREEAFLFHGRYCNSCGKKDHLHIHHLTYVNLFNEKMEDLMVLCEWCHKGLHRSKKVKR